VLGDPSKHCDQPTTLKKLRNKQTCTGPRQNLALTHREKQTARQPSTSRIVRMRCHDLLITRQKRYPLTYIDADGHRGKHVTHFTASARRLHRPPQEQFANGFLHQRAEQRKEQKETCTKTRPLRPSELEQRRHRETGQSGEAAPRRHENNVVAPAAERTARTSQ